MTVHYPIAFVCKEDVINLVQDDLILKQIAENITENQMELIADNMGDAYYNIEFQRSLFLAFRAVMIEKP
jgi:hypothetical protein